MKNRKRKYHKPVIESEKAFEAQTNTGITPLCFCTSAGSGYGSCSSSANDPSGF